MNEDNFSGAKIALTSGGRLLVYRRDDKPTIPWPGLWDLPGGGREGAESPEACALRELREEFGIALAPESIHWRRRYPGALPAQRDSYFLAAEVSDVQTAAIAFGGEGQYWAMMPLAEFLAHPKAVAHLQERLRDYLAAVNPADLGARP